MDKEKKNDVDTGGMKTSIRPIHILMPVLIGVGVVIWLFADEFSTFEWSAIPMNRHTALGLLLAILMVCGREFGMTWRYRSLTDGDLSWWQAFKVSMLCEFSSAVTPSAVGGSSLAMFFMHREGINFGRATTLMIITIFLDELFFVLSCPVVALLTPFDELFGTMNVQFSFSFNWVFWGIYAVIALWTLILFMGIIVRPQFIRSIIVGIFNWRILRRWRHGVIEMGDNMVAASVAARSKSMGWWLRAFGATVLSWTSRYLVVGALFFCLVAGANQWIVFARQAVVWLILMVCPTPGGSGVSEWLFREYYADMISTASLALVIMMVWRIISYYIYLVIGISIIPSWLKDGKRKC